MKQFIKNLFTKAKLDDTRLELQRQIRWMVKQKFGYIDRQIIHQYLSSHQIKKIHLGCGVNVLEGWLNADYTLFSQDVICFDATQRFPFADSCFDYIYSEHMIEHISYSQGLFMLSECFRILKPNGRVRIATPDFTFLLKLYQNPDTPLHKSYIKYTLDYCMRDAPYQGAIFVINNFVRDWGHLFIYDEKSLRMALTKAGFSEITKHDLQDSQDKNLRNLANEKRAPEGLVNLETITLEAVKL